MNWIDRMFSRRRLYNDLSGEIRQHLAEKIEELVASGMLREEATHVAYQEFGNATVIEERGREVWRWPSLENVLMDVRYGLRQLRRNPGFAAAAVLTVALGVGANTAIFSLIDAVLLKSLPVKDPEQLVLLGSKNRKQGTTDYTFYYPVYRQLRDQNRSLTDLAAFAAVPLNVKIDGETEPMVPGELVSGSYFSLLGVSPVAGRNITIDDDRISGGHPVAMISYGYWARRFALAPSVIGKAVEIDGTPFTIIGVTPSHFFGLEVGSAPEIMVPFMMQPQVMPEAESWLGRPVNIVNWLHVVGRLSATVTRQQVLANMGTIYHRIMIEEAGRIDEPWARSWLDEELVLATGSRGISELRTQFAKPLFILMFVVGLLLLIACTNVVNLLLARAAARQREIGVRRAIGAGTARLVRQLLTESLLLAMMGGAAGLILSSWATKAIINLISLGRTRMVLSLRPDVRVLTFTLALSIIAAVLFGLAPARRATRPDLTAVLSGTAGLGSAYRTSRVPVISQIAISVLLLVGAGPFVRTLHNLLTQDRGLNPESVLSVRLEPRGSDQKRGDNAIRLSNLYRRLQDGAEAIPGVRNASLASAQPTDQLDPHVRARTLDAEVAAAMVQVFPGYFATLGIPVLYGRDFASAEMVPGAPYVAVVNETLARQLFPKKNPLGRQFEFGRSLCQVVGVVKDAKYGNLRGTAPSVVYQPFLQASTGRGQMVLHVRVSGKADRVAGQLQRDIQGIDQNLPAFQVETLASELNAALGQERLIATLSMIFGLLALALVSVGLYGMMAYSVTRRTGEIGIRMALGAERGLVLRMILADGMRLTGIGVVIGLVAGLVLTRFVANVLYGVRPIDPFAFLAGGVTTAAAAAFAAYLPARRATKVDPMVALRYE